MEMKHTDTQCVIYIGEWNAEHPTKSGGKPLKLGHHFQAGRLLHAIKVYTPSHFHIPQCAFLLTECVCVRESACTVYVCNVGVSFVCASFIPEIVLWCLIPY